MADTPPPTTKIQATREHDQWAVGTHASGMHSCCIGDDCHIRKLVNVAVGFRKIEAGFFRQLQKNLH